MPVRQGAAIALCSLFKSGSMLSISSSGSN
jgi:hypothetical protein